MIAGEGPPFHKWNVFPICICLSPARRGPKDLGEHHCSPQPSGLPHPFEAGVHTPDPGVWGEMRYAHRDEDAERPRRRYRTRLWVRGVSGMWYFASEEVPGGVPGLWRRFARPRPSGRMDWCVLVPRAVASRLHIGSRGGRGSVSSRSRFAAAHWVGGLVISTDSFR